MNQWGFKSLMIMGQLLKTQVERRPSNPGKKGGFTSFVKLYLLNFIPICK